MSVAATKPYLTEAEFLKQERRAEFKSEFFEGEIFALAGGTRTHNLIGTNLTAVLRGQLEGRPCLTYNADLRVKIEATGLLTYPDASVVCGVERFLDDVEDTLLNPILVAEVLSDSTETYDRGTKFSQYRLIPSLRHILIISQREPKIECYTRTGEEWLLSEARGMHGELELSALEITLSLSHLFARVKFGTQPARLHP